MGEAHWMAENFAGLPGPQLVHSHGATRLEVFKRPKGAEAGGWGIFADVRPRGCGSCIRRVAGRWSPGLGAAMLLIDCEHWAHG